MKGRIDRPCAAARAVHALARQHRDARREARARRAALMLRGIEASLFGHRMPSAEALLSQAGWRRDPPGAWCLRCGGTLLRCERPRGGCGECRGAPRATAAVVRLGRYAPPLSQWVPAIKLRGWHSMGRALGQRLGEAALESVSCGHIPSPDLVVPVPVHWLRRVTRGIDHTAVLSEEAARVLGVCSRHCVRARLFRRQTGGHRSKRLTGDDRFTATRLAHACAGAHVLVIDDVLTTGATSGAIAAELRARGALSVSVAACAVADKPRRRGIRVLGSEQFGELSATNDVDNF